MPAPLLTADEHQLLGEFKTVIDGARSEIGNAFDERLLKTKKRCPQLETARIAHCSRQRRHRACRRSRIQTSREFHTWLKSARGAAALSPSICLSVCRRRQ